MSERAEPDDLRQLLDADSGGAEPVAPAQRGPDEPEADDFARPSIRRIVPAASADRLETVARLRAPVSVFDPGTMAGKRPIRLDAARPTDPHYVARVERELGVVRMVQVPVVETAEWREKEERRRAKQRPPKPCAAMRRHKSAKLRRLLGIDLDLGD